LRGTSYALMLAAAFAAVGCVASFSRLVVTQATDQA
jgi:DHA2 family multidrug resistance protein-like MFS transporter